MEEYIARVCYNTKEWKRPSGSEGKCENKDSYEHLYKFGHEEWLFDQSKSINGYHYSYLQPMGKYIYAGKRMDVHLFFFSKDFGKRYLGVLHNVECLTEKQSNEAYKIYKKNGWIEEMKDDIRAIGGGVEALDNPRYSLFNIRFKMDDAEINLSNPRIISKDDPSTRALYYRLYKLKGKLVFTSAPDMTKVQRGAVESKAEGRVRYNTDVKDVVYDPQHNKMQNAIKKLLEKSGNYKNVVLEKNYVDIKGTLISGKIDYYEIKTYAAKASIREAIGQILEYAHYPADKHADRLIIVGPNEPDKFDRMYLKYLRETYHLPIWFRSYSFEKNQLSDLI